MGFKFPLQKVLEHRKSQEDIAQRDFQAAVQELNLEIEKKIKMEEALSDAYAQAYRVQTKGSGQEIQTLQQIQVFIKGQKLLIERQGTLVSEKEKLVESKREFLRQKAIEYKMIERLKEKKTQQYKFEESKKESLQADEFNILRPKRSKVI